MPAVVAMTRFISARCSGRALSGQLRLDRSGSLSQRSERHLTKAFSPNGHRPTDTQRQVNNIARRPAIYTRPHAELVVVRRSFRQRSEPFEISQHLHEIILGLRTAFLCTDDLSTAGRKVTIRFLRESPRQLEELTSCVQAAVEGTDFPLRVCPIRTAV